ncbi:vegetative cell wall protein gp1-like [Perognathus longimembris pacificus]|uniref:vegetative cell wall protein gp1-like n=1 Tax=Perognathus longimembris pacificus TaxID=214514 RepID=UPI0020192C3A|nr:vegetative cell wall protein gp1-like [Perognathus longimembris pacificus]
MTRRLGPSAGGGNPELFLQLKSEPSHPGSDGRLCVNGRWRRGSPNCGWTRRSEVLEASEAGPRGLHSTKRRVDGPLSGAGGGGHSRGAVLDSSGRGVVLSHPTLMLVRPNGRKSRQPSSEGLDPRRRGPLRPAPTVHPGVLGEAEPTSLNPAHHRRRHATPPNPRRPSFPPPPPPRPGPLPHPEGPRNPTPGPRLGLTVLPTPRRPGSAWSPFRLTSAPPDLGQARILAANPRGSPRWPHMCVGGGGRATLAGSRDQQAVLPSGPPGWRLPEPSSERSADSSPSPSPAPPPSRVLPRFTSPAPGVPRAAASPAAAAAAALRNPPSARLASPRSGPLLPTPEPYEILIIKKVTEEPARVAASARQSAARAAAAPARPHDAGARRPARRRRRRRRSTELARSSGRPRPQPEPPWGPRLPAGL